MTLVPALISAQDCQALELAPVGLAMALDALKRRLLEDHAAEVLMPWRVCDRSGWPFHKGRVQCEEDRNITFFLRSDPDDQKRLDHRSRLQRKDAGLMAHSQFWFR